MTASKKHFPCNFYSFEYKPETWDFEVLIWVEGNIPDNRVNAYFDQEYADYSEFEHAVADYMDTLDLKWGFVPVAATYGV